MMVFLLGHLFVSQATTIIPFHDLGEMAYHSEFVVMAQVKQNYEFKGEASTTFLRTQLKVVQNLKGALLPGMTFDMQAFKKKVGNYETEVYGDVILEAGKRYLLFLELANNGLYRTKVMAYGAYEEFASEDGALLVPHRNSLDVHPFVLPGNSEPEGLAVYNKVALLDMLSGVIANEERWNAESAIAFDDPMEFYEEYQGRLAAPAHCTFITITGTSMRWNIFPNTALHIYTDNDADVDYAGSQAEAGSAVSTMSGTYAGLNQLYQGNTTYTPNCSGGSASGGNFIGHVAGLNGTNTTLVMFNDPCSEIGDLSSCNGTLAIGGLYKIGTHTYDASTFGTGGYGYVIFNNGTGACLSAANYRIVMIHELGHTLGAGHIAASNGAANMNPSCCNSVSSLDIQCFDYAYAPALPIELMAFNGFAEEKAIRLDWETATEANNNYFLLERTSDGEEFEELAQISGAGTSFTPSSYEFIDEEPITGTNYYRLSQVDYDGTKEEVGKVVIDFYDGVGFTLTNNLIQGDDVIAQVNLPQDNDLEFQVYDLNGRAMLHRATRLEKGYNEVQLSVKTLPAGVYLLNLKQGYEVTSLRFVKL